MTEPESHLPQHPRISNGPIIVAAPEPCNCEHLKQKDETSHARKPKSSRCIDVLPVELQRELSFPSIADGVVDRSKRVARGIVQEIRVANPRPKVGVIQQVEELGPEFHV